MNFEAFIREIQDNHWKVHGVEVYVQGKCIHAYADTRNRYPIYSATKTITSLAVGMAVDEGKLNIRESLLHYLPDSVIKEMQTSQRECYQNITIKDLLTMSVSGYPFRPEGNYWLKDSLSVPVKIKKENKFSYNNTSAFLAGVAATNALNENLYDYLCRKLFAPLGIENPPCEFSPEGYFYGASKMELSVNELSRIGLLISQSGVYQGTRIVSDAYIKEATSLQQQNSEDGYGYLIWKYRNGVSINGKWNQRCYILPNREIVITYLADTDMDASILRKQMEKHLLSVV